MGHLTPAELVAEYKAAYFAANGHEVEVERRGSWYVVGRYPLSTKFQRKAIEFAIGRLRGRRALTPTEGE